MKFATCMGLAAIFGKIAAIELPIKDFDMPILPYKNIACYKSWSYYPNDMCASWLFDNRLRIVNDGDADYPDSIYNVLYYCRWHNVNTQKYADTQFCESEVGPIFLDYVAVYDEENYKTVLDLEGASGLHPDPNRYKTDIELVYQRMDKHEQTLKKFEQKGKD